MSIANNNLGGETGYSVLVQPDAKIVITGVTNLPGQDRQYVLLRFTDTGSLDSSFDGDGKVIAGTGGGGYDVAEAMALQSDGRLVVVGFGSREFLLARYNSDGSLDPTFGAAGKVMTDFRGTQDEARAVVMQPDGRILVAGRSYRPSSSNSDFVLARYNSDGSPDTSFDSDGFIFTEFTAVNSVAFAVALQSDGKILVAGYAGTDFALARYHSDGSPDTTFDSDGKVTTDFGGNGDSAEDIVVYPDGRILLVGTSGAIGSSDFALARYNADGSPDTTFDTDGKVTTNMGGYDIGRGVVVQDDGRITVAGFAMSNRVGLARYNADGSPDTTFEMDGRVMTMFNNGSSATALTLQPDGKILVAGTTSATNNDYLLARFNTDGSVDSSFGNAGRFTTDFSVYDVANDILLLPDNRIVLAGALARNTSATTLDFGITRHVNDSTLLPPPTPTPTATPTPSATPEPTATPTATPTPTASQSPSATATPSPEPTPSPSATPTPEKPRQLLNIATRLRVQTGENVLIGGLIVTGEEPKKVIIRAVGPSLSGVFAGALSDTTLELYDGETLLAGNDDWKDTQQAEIEATTIPPNHELESAIVYTLPPGSYTAVMSGKGGRNWHRRGRGLRSRSSRVIPAR